MFLIGVMIIKIWMLLVLLLAPVSITYAGDTDTATFLRDLFAARAELVLEQQPDAICPFYHLSIASADQAYSMEVQRSIYLRTWAHKRGVSLLGADSRIHILEQHVHGNRADVVLYDTTEVTYVYDAPLFSLHTFMLGARHTMKLQRENGRWAVIEDVYTDAIADNPKLVPKAASCMMPAYISVKNDNRVRAVSYADRYVPSYNMAYRDYTDIGGDCTNFVSQVLGDASGGALPMTNDWRYGSGKSTASWTMAQSFHRFLSQSEYATVIQAGSFHDVMEKTDKHPYGAIYELEPGDVIAYEENGAIVHVSVVVGRDSGGYVVVNSHTADRYHVPWDLGWDERTTFWLWHIHF